MKKVLTGLFVAFMISAVGQETKQKIIIDVTSTDNKVYKSVLLTINLMSKSYPDSQFEVIVYGEAVPMLMKNQSIVSNDIINYADNENVVFTACEVSMELFGIEKDQLLNGVGTVGNAIEAIVRKQDLGWGYIKSGN
jgi:intracellular sulfur oxidation DsrE/DsrF family protein